MTGFQPISGASHGVFAISATPFSDDGALDLASTDTLVDFYLGHGVSGLTILGMMGEAGKLSGDESRQFAERVFTRVGNRVPVVVGVSAAGTDNLVAFGRQMMAAGAAGVMVAPLPTLRTDEQVEAYFTDICGRLGPDIPVVFQDFPQATGVSVSVPTLERIFARCENLVMLKHEDNPGLEKLSRVRAADATRRRISVLVGNSGLFLPQEMARGADGAMTGYGYPEMLVQVCAASAEGDFDRAEDIFDAHLPLVRYEAQPGLGLAIRKEVLRRRGAIASAHVRAPGPRLSERDLGEITRLIERLDARLMMLGQL